MDYEFTKDSRGQFVAVFSMGHEAIAHYFSDELGAQAAAVTALLQALGEVEQGLKQEHLAIGHTFQLQLNRREAKVLNLSTFDDSEFTDDDEIQLYEQEQTAVCGLQDFKVALQSWLDFIA